MSSISSKQDLFHGLVAALEDVDFRYSLRFDDELDSNSKVISSQLQQIFFAHPIQIGLAQRFLPGFLFLIDGTFNTNKLNLVLISVVGINNLGLSFPVVVSFARTESKACFDFVFKAMNEWIFKPVTLQTELPPPQVCLSDQAAGLIASAPQAMPQTLTQFCDWHVAQNIKKRLAEKRYTKREREEIMNSIWDYIKSPTKSALVENKAKLYAQLKDDEVTYIERNWVPRERCFLRLYTRRYANLGCNSSQRAEGLHSLLKGNLNPQLRDSHPLALQGFDLLAHRFQSTMH